MRESRSCRISCFFLRGITNRWRRRQLSFGCCLRRRIFHFSIVASLPFCQCAVTYVRTLPTCPRFSRFFFFSLAASTSSLQSPDFLFIGHLILFFSLFARVWHVPLHCVPIGRAAAPPPLLVLRVLAKCANYAAHYLPTWQSNWLRIGWVWDQGPTQLSFGAPSPCAHP